MSTWCLFLSLSLSVGAIGRNGVWILAVSVSKKKHTKKQTRNEASSQRCVFLGLKSSSWSSGKKKKEIFGSTSVLNLLFVESEKWSKLRLSQRQSDSPLMEDTISGTICRLFVKSRSIPDGRWTDDENESALTQLSLASRAWKSVHISTCGKREINKKQRRMDKSIKT